jgi:glycosyltransferase XagB
MLGVLFYVVLGASSLCLTAVACTSLWWMLYAWRRPETPDEDASLRPVSDPRLSFSLIVPARHEQRVLGYTLHRLLGLDHPNFEILVVVGSDDDQTERIARAASESFSDRVRVLVVDGQPKTKPRALNTALPVCTGDIVAVFDAEDDVHPQLLRHVEAWFRGSDAEVVQGAVQLMDYRSRWYAPRAILEYFFWFRSKLRFQARWRFVPLGGNTIFIRRPLLDGVRGWDPGSLTEDCDLGARLSILSARVAVVTLPQLATREEVPPSVGALFRQRTRWNQGFLQVLRKGDWRHLPLRAERFLAAYTLVMPFLQALVAFSLPAAIAGFLLLKVPPGLALLTLVPGLITLITLVVESTGLREFCRIYGLPCRWHDHIRLFLGTIPYQALLSCAAVWAAVREARGHRDWAKTPHRGVSRFGPTWPAHQPVRSAPIFPGGATRGT